ncbi:TlpA family protein disulfide reductase [Pseudoalteromonas obscura]|uniref:TlpA disulfide reductase family protein n=1 Tax=Pseudoalteromonas obscura TaxID=3048491 RepID=A0ABT7ERQ2_9GAMM|nr:TlpA disulfide reductase family protein [Pseudoalteromonas sp. P94(2023)]MDK2597727.1 TlpA disulfide reductase family protein [Pseudoalteromonas sp. P94(2023)]
MKRYLMLLFVLCFTTSANANITHFGADQVIGQNKLGEPVFRSTTTPTIVTFWASWCVYCKQLLPLLEGLQRKLTNERIRVVVVNTKEEGKLGQTRRTYKSLLRQFEQRGLQIEFVFDKRDALYNRFKKPGLPYTLVIEKNGQISYAQAGYSERLAQPMLEAIQQALDKNTSDQI